MHGLSKVSPRVLVAVHALWGAAAKHLGDDAVAAEVEGAAHRKGERTVLAPPPDDRGRPRVVGAHDVWSRHRQEHGDLLGHLPEYAARRQPARDERGHP